MDNEMIIAQRGSERRTFSASIWKAMRLNAYGWRMVADEPEVVSRMKLEASTSPEQYSKMIKEARLSGDQDKIKEVLNATIDKQKNK